ncbi:MAG: 30S ribosomal protein S16 [Dehalococcoidia bacterium]
MLKIRLTRTGRRKRPYFRLVVTEHTAPRDGAFVEIVGHYDPVSDPAVVEIKAERVQHWLSHGAQPTETVHRLLAQQGLMAPPKEKPRSKKAEAKRQAREEAERAAEASGTEATKKDA